MNEYLWWTVLFVVPLLLWRPHTIRKTLILTGIALICLPGPRDSTDPPDGPRSGMIIYKDYLTGCQYLKAGIFGGISPRVDTNGKPICGQA